MPRETIRVLVARLPVDPDRGDWRERVPLSVRATALLVSFGGGTGALVRALLEAAIKSGSGWPWATLLINVTGSGLLALLLVLIEEMLPRSRVARPLIGTGFLGGYTTFSTFAVETVTRLDSHQVSLALGYIVASATGALAATFLGLYLGRATFRLVSHERRAEVEAGLR